MRFNFLLKKSGGRSDKLVNQADWLKGQLPKKYRHATHPVRKRIQ